MSHCEHSSGEKRSRVKRDSVLCLGVEMASYVGSQGRPSDEVKTALTPNGSDEENHIAL